jgi:hypothetical protein
MPFVHLPPVTEASYSSDDGSESKVCQKSQLTAPQRDSDASPENPSVSSKIQDWCTKMNGQTIGKAPKGVDTAFGMFQQPFQAFWLSASIWYNAPPDNSCGNTATISKDECITTLTTAMTACDPNSGVTHGASLAGQCINYVSCFGL